MENKVMEALEHIKTHIIIETEIKVNQELGVVNPYYNDYEIILQALQRLEAIDNAEPSKAMERVNYLSAILPDWQKVNNGIDTLITIKNYILKTQEDKQFIDLILNNPQLLNVFAFDGIHTWEEFEDNFSDEDKEYINTTKEEFEYMRNQLIKRGKIDE